MSSLLTYEVVFFQPATLNTCAAVVSFGEVDRSAPAELIQILFLTFPLASITQCAAVAIIFSSSNIPEQKGEVPVSESKIATVAPTKAGLEYPPSIALLDGVRVNKDMDMQTASN